MEWLTNNITAFLAAASAIVGALFTYLVGAAKARSDSRTSEAQSITALTESLRTHSEAFSARMAAAEQRAADLQEQLDRERRLRRRVEDDLHEVHMWVAAARLKYPDLPDLPQKPDDGTGGGV